MARAVDVLVVGAGVVGLSIASELARTGGLSIAVVDKGGPGAGTSGRSAGVICRHDHAPSYQRLSLVGHARMQQLAREEGLAFNAWGNLTVIREGDELPPRDRFPELVAAPSGMYETELLDHDTTIDRFPWLRDSEVVASLFEPHIGFIDPLELIDIYRSILARTANVTVAYGTPVLRMERRGDRITRVLTRRGAFAPGLVVNAAGAWGDKLAKLAGSSVAVAPQRMNVAVAVDYEGDETRVPLHGVAGVNWEGAGVWARGEVGGATLFGQHRDAADPAAPTTDPDFFDNVADAGFVERLAPFVDSLYRWAGTSVLPGWTCVYDTTPDGFPLIGHDVAVDNLVHALGMNGHGMTIHPGVARCVTQLVVTGSLSVDVSDVLPWSEQLDFGSLAPSRFEEGRPLTLGRF